MYMLVMVLNDTARLNDVLLAWEKAGVRGVTILESTGLARTLDRYTPGGAAAGLDKALNGGHIGHHTLFAVIDDVDLAESVVEHIHPILGDLNDPETGILFLLPVLFAWGMGTAVRPPDGEARS